MRIASYEIGVLVWPGLFAEGALMKGMFLQDAVARSSEEKEKSGEEMGGNGEADKPVVALRMPYDLPLQGYGKSEVPWVATMSHMEPDKFGQVYRVD